RRQRAQEIAEVVGERMKLEPHRVGGERSARQSRPLDRAFALLDPLLARPALVVECNDPLGRAAHVRHDEADAGIKFSGIPLDLGGNPRRLGPGSGLIAEIGMEPPDFIGRSSDRTLEQVANPTLQDLVGRQPDRILDPLRFEKLVDLGHGEGCIGSKIDARDLASIALHDRVEHILPAVGAVDIAGTQRGAFQVTELIEHEQRVITGAGVMAVPHAILLLAMGRAHARIHVEHDAAGGRRPCTRSIHWPDKSARAERFLSVASHCVSKRPIWLGEAAWPTTALPPTIQRIAGSCRRRSASLTSSYPARRPNTDCRSKPTSAWRPFLPVRASASISPAITLNPRASSSSR